MILNTVKRLLKKFMLRKKPVSTTKEEVEVQDMAIVSEVQLIPVLPPIAVIDKPEIIKKKKGKKGKKLRSKLKQRATPKFNVEKNKL
jgi:hypothetical protein